jgi:hypothetical protein
MNLLDEHIPEDQRQELLDRRIAVRQIGVDTGCKGMKDRDIIALLHNMNRPTFFTRDVAFYDRRLCHQRYCIVYLDVEDDEAALYVRRTLRHRELGTRARRMGTIVRVTSARIRAWRADSRREESLAW